MTPEELDAFREACIYGSAFGAIATLASAVLAAFLLIFDPRGRRKLKRTFRGWAR